MEKRLKTRIRENRLEARIDDRALDANGACRFDGLTAKLLNVSTVTGLVGLRTIRLAGMPELDTIDLGGCPAGFELYLEADATPAQVLLPAGGARVFIERSVDFPVLRIDGRIDELVIRCSARHPVAGTYLLDGSDGVMLLPNDTLEPLCGIERYIRIDQSERGLQYKELRRGLSSSDVLWKLADAKACPLEPIDRVARMDHATLLQFACDSSDEAVEARETWLNGIDQPWMLCRHLLRLLIGGAPPQAIWALRCALNCRARADARAAIVGHALLAATVLWSNRRPYWRPMPLDADDLRLLFLSRSTGLTRRCERSLTNIGMTAQLSELVRFSASLPARHHWAADLDRMIEAAINRWHCLQAAPVDQLTVAERNDRKGLPFCNRRALEQLLSDAIGMHNRRTAARLIELAYLLLDGDDRVRLARKLIEGGNVLSRPLVISALQSGSLRKGKLLAWATRYLLGQENREAEEAKTDENLIECS